MAAKKSPLSLQDGVDDYKARNPEQMKRIGWRIRENTPPGVIETLDYHWRPSTGQLVLNELVANRYGEGSERATRIGTFVSIDSASVAVAKDMIKRMKQTMARFPKASHEHEQGWIARCKAVIASHTGR